MKPIDFAKAAGVMTVILVLNILGSIVAVSVYAFFIEPGKPQEFYDAAALRIAPWCSYTIGTALFFAAGYFCARRRPQRNGYLFGATITVLYAIIDAAVVVLAGAFALNFVLATLAKLVAAAMGAFLARKRPSKVTA